jgi:hypothetical protein
MPWIRKSSGPLDASRRRGVSVNADCTLAVTALDFSRVFGVPVNSLLRLIVVGGLLAFAVPMIALGMPRNNTYLLGPVHLLLFVIAVAVYLLPAALAFYRDCKAAIWIAVVNVFLGWTIFGWFVAIGWAVSGKVRTLAPTIATPPGQALPGR